jgi:hypothetical protein
MENGSSEKDFPYVIWHFSFPFVRGTWDLLGKGGWPR